MQDRYYPARIFHPDVIRIYPLIVRHIPSLSSTSFPCELLANAPTIASTPSFSEQSSILARSWKVYSYSDMPAFAMRPSPEPEQPHLPFPGRWNLSRVSSDGTQIKGPDCGVLYPGCEQFRLLRTELVAAYCGGKEDTDVQLGETPEPVREQFDTLCAERVHSY